MQNQHLLNYNIQAGNGLFVHIPQQSTFKMTKAGLLYHDMRHLLKNNNNAHIMVNYSYCPIPQVEEKNKQYTVSAIRRADCASLLQNITIQPVKWILHEFDNNILHNIAILCEYFWMDEDVYQPSVPHLWGKKVRQNIHNVEPIIEKNVPRALLIDTRKSPYAVTSCKPSALDSWTPYPDILCLPQ